MVMCNNMFVGVRLYFMRCVRNEGICSRQKIQTQKINNVFHEVCFKTRIKSRLAAGEIIVSCS